MLYWKYSSNRIFFLNEYWILIPTMALVNYVIIGKIRSHKKRIEVLKRLKDQIEHEKKLRRILFLSFGLNGWAYIKYMRGGSNFINTDYIECGIETGLRYLDDNRLRNIIHDLYRNKRKGQVIYITATAVCHLAQQYGKTFLALPVAIGDFGFTNFYQTARKVVVTVLLGGVGPLWFVGGPVALIGAFILSLSGLRIAFTDLDSIPTSPIYEMGSAKNLKTRIPNSLDVVVVNNRNKIIMTNSLPEKKECWLADQAFLNSNCKVKSTEIPNAIDLVSHDLDYKEVVNMQDVTGLDKVDFSDVLDLGQAEPCPPKSHQGKTVNFLDKFGDSGTIDEKDTWDISESPVPEKKYLRTRNEL